MSYPGVNTRPRRDVRRPQVVTLSDLKELAKTVEAAGTEMQGDALLRRRGDGRTFATHFHDSVVLHDEEERIAEGGALKMALALKAELDMERAPLLSGGGMMGDEVGGGRGQGGLSSSEGLELARGGEMDETKQVGGLRMITRHEVEKLEREMLRAFESELQSLKQRLDANRSTQAAALKHFIECRKIVSPLSAECPEPEARSIQASRPRIRALPADKAALLTLKNFDPDAAQLLLSHLHRRASTQARQLEQMAIKLKHENAEMGKIQSQLHTLEQRADMPELKEKLSSTEAEMRLLQEKLTEAQSKVSELSSVMNGREVDVRKAVDRERAAEDEARGLRKELERALLEGNASRRQSEYDKADVKRLEDQLDEKLRLIGRFEAEIEEMKEKMRSADAEAELRFAEEKSSLHDLLEKERRKVIELGAARHGLGAMSRAEGDRDSQDINEEDGIADNSTLRRKLAMVEAALADANTRRNIAVFERDQAQKDLAALQEKYNAAIQQLNEQKGRRHR